MRTLPLEAVHAGLGAEFGDVAGWRLPLDYGDPAAEQRAVRTAAGLVDRSADGRTRVDGADRTAFLDGVLTNDVGALAQGRGLHAAALDPKGRVRGDVVVYHGGDHYFLTTEPEATESVRAHLSQLLVSDDATVTDVTANWCTFGLFGPRSPEIAATLIGSSPPPEAYRVVAAERAGTLVVLARSPHLGGCDGFELWVPPDGAERVWRSLLDARAVPVGLRAWEALRIEAGRPRYPVDMNETTLAIEARLEPSISFTKGCYVGQEVVSRATRVGRVNRLLVGLAVEGAPPAPGAPVAADGRPVGAVTSAARSEALRAAIALAYVRRESSEPGTELSVGGRRARVAALPFVRA